MKHWKLTEDNENILTLTLDRQDSSVNSLSREVLSEFDQLLDEIKKNKNAIGLIIRSGKKSFIPGADINKFLSDMKLRLVTGNAPKKATPVKAVKAA